MKVNQIADILNDVYGELIGTEDVLQEDLSNIVSVGQRITATTQWDENFDNYVKKIIDKVGRTIYVDRAYSVNAPDILKDSWEYGSILEKVRVTAGDFDENPEWTLTKDSEFDVFGFNPVEVDAKYFNYKTTFLTKFSITKKQMKSAFNSAADMNRFIAMVENRIRMKMAMASEALIMRTIVNLIGEKIKSGKNVVNLLDEYKTATGNASLTAATAMADKDFLRIAAKTVLQYKSFLKKASTLFNDEAYVTFTPEDKLKSVFITDFARALETTLYADTFHNEFIKLEGYSEVPYWQGSGKDNSFADRAKIDCLPASSNDVGDPVTKSGVVAVLFDEEAAMVCNEDPDVRSIYNPEGNFYNYWYSFDASYYNDLAENVVVFTIE